MREAVGRAAAVRGRSHSGAPATGAHRDAGVPHLRARPAPATARDPERGALEAARAVTGALEPYAIVGFSPYCPTARRLHRAIEEAELVLKVLLQEGARPEAIDSSTYRLLVRTLAAEPEEVRRFYENTVAPLVRYDAQYHTDLAATLKPLFAHNCNMNQTAGAIYLSPPYNRLPAGAGAGADRPRPKLLGASRAAGARAQGLPHPLTEAATLTGHSLITTPRDQPAANGEAAIRLRQPPTTGQQTEQPSQELQLATVGPLGRGPGRGREQGTNIKLGPAAPFELIEALDREAGCVERPSRTDRHV